MLKSMTLALSFMVSISALAYNDSVPTYSSGEDAALQVCQGLSYGGSITNCMLIVQGHRFATAAVQACGEMSYDGSKTACLQSIVGDFFEKDAVSFCSNLSYDGSKQACLNSVANKAYQSEAIQICSNLSYDGSKTSCLTTIENKLFDTRFLNLCGQAGYDAAITSCLGQLQSRPLSADYSQDQNSYGQSSSIDLTIVIDIVSGQVILGGRAVNNGYNNNNSNNGGNYGGTVIHDGRDTGTVRVDTSGTCVVKQTGERVSSDKFYSLVSEAARRDNKCAIGRLAKTAGSGRVYDQTGRRVNAELGGLTYEKVADVKRNNGLRGCTEFTCDNNQ